MTHHRSKAATDRGLPSGPIPWRSFEDRTASAFTIAGALLVSSLFAPVGLAAFTDRAWVSGLLLVGLGVVAVVCGLLGLYPRAKARSPRLATVGVVGAGIAALSALALLAMVGIAVVGVGAMGMALGTPMGVFSAIALSMAIGFSAGFLSFGTQLSRSDGPSRVAGWLLLVGGGLLLVPIVAGVARFAVGIGPPPWLLLPVIGLVSFDTLAIGLTLRSEGDG